jgi:hypothetical protein
MCLKLFLYFSGNYISYDGGNRVYCASTNGKVFYRPVPYNPNDDWTHIESARSNNKVVTTTSSQNPFYLVKRASLDWSWRWDLVSKSWTYTYNVDETLGTLDVVGGTGKFSQIAYPFAEITDVKISLTNRLGVLTNKSQTYCYKDAGSDFVCKYMGGYIGSRIGFKDSVPGSGAQDVATVRLPDLGFGGCALSFSDFTVPGTKFECAAVLSSSGSYRVCYRYPC